MFVEVNDRLCEITGYERNELIGHSTRVLYLDDEHFQGIGASFDAETRVRGVVNAASQLRRKDGKQLDILLSCSLLDPAHPDAGLACAVVDVSDRKHVEAILQRLSQAVEQSPVAVVMTDLEGRITYVNPRFTQLTGYAAEEVMGQNPRLLKSGETPAEDYERLWKTILSGRQWRGEFHNRKRNGELYWEMASISPIRDADGAITQFIGVKEDITARKKSQERMREQAALLDQTQDIIAVCDMAGRLVYLNQAAERLTGCLYNEVRDRGLAEVLCPRRLTELHDAQREAAARGLWSGEIAFLFPEERECLLDCRLTLVKDKRAQPKSLLFVGTDITEKKRLMQQYLRAQRLESVGTLASGVAHDLNNILSPVLMGVELLELRPQDENTLGVLNMMKESARRGVDTVKQLLTFARGADSPKGPVQPRHLLKDIARLLEQTFPKNIQIYADYSGQPAPVLAEASQVHQVLMNLCVNARDAMPDGGVLYITLENQTLNETTMSLHPKARPISYVVFRVSDSGTGIPAKILDRIFDPFFTTKPQGKGTGLGLATVLGIVENHGGFVLVDSKPGKGTTFQVFLPACAPVETCGGDIEWSAVRRGQGELVLVVDDEAAILHLAGEILLHGGYTPLTASNAAEALHHYEKHHEQIRAVLTDIMMPFGDGRQLIMMLYEQNPRMPIIAMSGLATDEFRRETLRRGARAFLRKPFRAEEVLELLGSVLA